MQFDQFNLPNLNQVSFRTFWTLALPQTCCLRRSVLLTQVVDLEKISQELDLELEEDEDDEEAIAELERMVFCCPGPLGLLLFCSLPVFVRSPRRKRTQSGSSTSKSLRRRLARLLPAATSSAR
jgi:hypothetical protein